MFRGPLIDGACGSVHWQLFACPFSLRPAIAMCPIRMLAVGDVALGCPWYDRDCNRPTMVQLFSDLVLIGLRKHSTSICGY
jgi:hypothetical protein